MCLPLRAETGAQKVGRRLLGGLGGSQAEPGDRAPAPRPRAASCRATATWYNDSGSDDSRRWSDQLSLDEKDGFIFVNYSEGQSRPHLQAPLNHPHPNPIEARNYSRLKPGNSEVPCPFVKPWGLVRVGGLRRRATALLCPIPVTKATRREGLMFLLV